MKQELQINEFFVEGGDQERSHVLLHITEPGDNEEEEEKGYFFAVVEINNGTIEQIEHLQQMIDDLESGYYETNEEEGKSAFETTLEYINRRGHHVLEYKNSLTHCLVGVIRDNELSFAYHGSPHAVLFYQGKNNLQELNILAQQEEEAQPDHLFSSMIQGNINSGDYFFVATPHVSDYFTYDRVKKIISSRPAKQSASHMQKVLADLRTDLSFGGVLFHSPKRGVSKKISPADTPSTRGSAESIDQLLSSERSTEEMLSPPLLGNLKKKYRQYQDKKAERSGLQKRQKTKQEKRKLASAQKKKGRMETNYRPREQKGSFVNLLLVSLGKVIVSGAIGLFQVLKKIAILLGRGAVILILLITNKDNKRADVIASARKMAEAKKESLSELPLVSKILFVVTIVFALIFVSSISYLKVKESRQAKIQTYNNHVQAVIDKKNSADASMIYGDQARALSLLQEARKLIAELPKNSKDRETKALELQAEIEKSLRKLQKWQDVDAEIIADLAGVDPDAQTSELVLIDDKLAAYGSDSQTVYFVNKDTKKIELKEQGAVPRLYNASTPKEQDKITFLTGETSIAEYDKESGLISSKDIAFPYNNTKLADLFVYNRRLYTLDPANNQIYKHNPTQTGFDKGSAWIKSEDIDLRDAVSLTIDGDIFVLKQNGEIIKFAGGKKQDFSINLDPPLDNPSQIWTYNDVNNIYILESSNKRVVVTDKQGKLLKQYTASQWQGPTGMVVDEAEGVIYVLDNNKIYRFLTN